MHMEKKTGDARDVNTVHNLKDVPDINDVSLHVHDVEDVKKQPSHVLYGVEDTPSWYLCILLGFQVRLSLIFYISAFNFDFRYVFH